MMTRTQAIKRLRHGFKLSRTFHGVSGSTSHETRFNLTLIPGGMKYTDKGYALPRYVDAVFDRTYKVRLTPKQVLSYIKRNFPAGVREPATLSANSGVCPSPTLGD